jgi:hypothetical protein
MTTSLDCVGPGLDPFASERSNRLLRGAMPGPSQVAICDRVPVRMSRVVDPDPGHAAGKSVLAIWPETDAGTPRKP